MSGWRRAAQGPHRSLPSLLGGGNRTAACLVSGGLVSGAPISGGQLCRQANQLPQGLLTGAPSSTPERECSLSPDHLDAGLLLLAMVSLVILGKEETFLISLGTMRQRVRQDVPGHCAPG